LEVCLEDLQLPGDAFNLLPEVLLLDILRLSVRGHDRQAHNCLEVFQLAALLEEAIILILQLLQSVVLACNILFHGGVVLGKPLQLQIFHLEFMLQGGVLFD